MNTPQRSRAQLAWGTAIRFFGGIFGLGLLIFLPAGTFAYWQGWAYLGMLTALLLPVAGYLFFYAPDLLALRFQMREKVTRQKRIVSLSWIPFVAGFCVPGLDQRFGWSHVPAWSAVAANLLCALAYFGVFLVFRENHYASRIVEVSAGQKVISTGPYALVRHPMYACVVFFYIFTPIALGSIWGVLPALTVIPILAARLLNEEIVLAEGLAGYVEYTRKVRYRLFPGLW